MDKETFTLIAALLAAIAGAANVYFGYLSTSAIERERVEVARENEKRKELRGAVASFAAELAKGIWQANWLLWNASQNTAQFSKKNLDEYDKEMKRILPALLTTRALVAA